MGEWRARYADKVVTAEEAIRGILPGRRILIGSGAAEPVSLVKAIRGRRVRVAVARGIRGFQADVLATNKPMLDVFHESGLSVSATLHGSVYHLEMLFPEGPT